MSADEGRRVGGAVAADLAAEDRRTGTPVSGSQLDWDRRYGGGRMWTGNPNGTLVAEATRMAPGRALDVGAGEGADALWLAEQGWEVTACDISGRALQRLVDEARRRELRVECLSTRTPTFGSTTSPPWSPTRPAGRWRCTRRGLDPQAPPPSRTTSTTSFSGPSGMLAPRSPSHAACSVTAP